MPTLNLGRVGFVNKGTWLISTAYKINDTVTYLGGTYACLIANTGQTPILGGTIYWQEWVANDVVHKSGAETITDVKTFTSSPIVPDATLSGQATNKGQLDLKAPLASPSFTGTPTSPNFSYKPTPVTIISWSYVTTTITLNVASHTFIAGDYIEVGGLTATTNIPNGVHLVTSVTDTTIVFTYALTPTGTAGVSSATVKGYMTTNGRTNGIGEGQTWKNVAASRVVGTTYTNSTGKPIEVSITITSNIIDNMTVIISGLATLRTHMPVVSNTYNLTFIVPNGDTYSVSIGGTPTIIYWTELR